MIITMINTRMACEDGFAVKSFEAGKTYEVGERVGLSFLHHSCARNATALEAAEYLESVGVMKFEVNGLEYRVEKEGDTWIWHNNYGSDGTGFKTALEAQAAAIQFESQYRRGSCLQPLYEALKPISREELYRRLRPVPTNPQTYEDIKKVEEKAAWEAL